MTDLHIVPSTEPITVASILDRYERECLSSLAPRTQRDYRRHLIVLRAQFGERIADELRPRDFAPFLTVQGRGRIQRVRQLAVLSAALTQAVSHWYLIERNVLRDVARPKSKPRDRLVLDSEFQAMLARVSVRMALAMRLAVMTGQRQGDIIRMRWSDVRDMALHVEQAKTGKRIAIAVNAELEAVLDECWRLKGAESVYILPTRSGTPYTSEGFRACWQRAMDRYVRSGGQRFHFHDLRALAATKCKTPEEAMRLLGHTTLAMTMRVYRRGIEHVQPVALP